MIVCQNVTAQSVEDFAVEITATTQVSPPQITLHWKRISDTTYYTLFRKEKSALAWDIPFLSLSTTDSTFTDTTVVADSNYEYQIVADHYHDTTYWQGTGYILAGIHSPALHDKGALILLVDSTLSDSCSAAIHTLMKDISCDGWQVIRHDVPRTMHDTGVKALIVADYARYPNVTAVQIVGHIAVPYSGDLNPDGHPDHLGAWPADIYYANLTDAFTDYTVSDTLSSYPANRNRIGDGKWDKTTLNHFSELQVARVDLNNMPAFAHSEAQLTNNYLARDHSYKMDSLNIRHRALINDNFGVFATYYASLWYYEAFASCGWRNFAPLVSRDSIAQLPFISSLNTGSYQWAYGCGGGNFQGASGIGNTDSFATNNVNGIFTMLFGSYFGDWNVQNNFLRAPLCSNVPALTNCWAGRPYWFFHHMALGENIGYSARLSQNNDGTLYGPANIYGIQAYVHEALMGDLSLRSDYIKRASALSISTASHRGANLTWTSSPDAGVTGYYIYRSDSGEFFKYNLLNRTPVTGTSFFDTTGITGLKYYMVRPVKLQVTPSGGYYNLGIGITDSATVYFPAMVFVTGVDTICTGISNAFTASATGVVAPHYNWKKNGASVGTDSVRFTTNTLADGDIVYCQVSATVGGTALATSDSIAMTVLPNPVAGTISGPMLVCATGSISLSDSVSGGTWTSSAAYRATVNTSGTVSGISTGTAVITYTVSNVCGSSSAYHALGIAVSPLAGSIAGGSSVCPGGSIALHNTGTGTGGTWSSSNTTVATVDAGGGVTGIMAGTTLIKYVVANTCGADSTGLTFTVNALPTAGAITGPATVCQGSVVTLADSASGGYFALSNTRASHVAGTITGITPGLDTVLYIVSNPCGTAIAQKTITINATIVPSVSIASNIGDTICSHDTATFTATPVNGGSTPVYEWYKFSSYVASGSTLRYAPANNDVIKCYLVSSVQCPAPDTVVSSSIRMLVYPSINPTNHISTTVRDSISYPGQVVTFNSELSNCGRDGTYQWYLNGDPVAGATNNTYSLTLYNTNATVYCVNTCNSLCASATTDTSNTVTVYGYYASLEQVNSAVAASCNLVIFPNPNNGNFTLSANLETALNGKVHYDILDITGKVVMNGTANAVNGVIREPINLNAGRELAAGQYILRLVTPNTVGYVHFVMQ